MWIDPVRRRRIGWAQQGVIAGKAGQDTPDILGGQTANDRIGLCRAGDARRHRHNKHAQQGDKRPDPADELNMSR